MTERVSQTKCFTMYPRRGMGKDASPAESRPSLVVLPPITIAEFRFLRSRKPIIIARAPPHSAIGKMAVMGKATLAGGNMEPSKPSRRDFIKAGAGAVGAMALDSVSVPAARGTSHGPRLPNFIFVTTDGHRPQALSLNGNRILQTPNFDRIGREGMQFQNSFVVNALCLPSRATALTGLYSHTTGCVDNNNRVIPADIPMFTDLLREAGYEVALFGKAHVGRLGERQWDHYFGFPGADTDYFWPRIQAGSHGKIEPT